MAQNRTSDQEDLRSRELPKLSMRPILWQLFFFLTLVGTSTASIVGVIKSNRADNRAKQADALAKASEEQAQRAIAMAKSAETQAAAYTKYVKLLRLAKIIERTGNVVGKDEFETAIKLRNHIYQDVPLNVQIRKLPPGFDFMDFDKAYLMSTRNDPAAHVCGGLTLLYLAALESQGIPARYVGCFSDDKEPYQSHASVEFWYKGKWHASDPSFNVMYTHNGEFLSYAELYGLLQDGRPYEITSNGYEIITTRNIENYPVKARDLMKYVVVHPAEVWRETKRFEYPTQLLPRHWDGAITFGDGNRKDVRVLSGIYEFLRQGPLR